MKRTTIAEMEKSVAAAQDAISRITEERDLAESEVRKLRSELNALKSVAKDAEGAKELAQSAIREAMSIIRCELTVRHPFNDENKTQSEGHLFLRHMDSILSSGFPSLRRW